MFQPARSPARPSGEQLRPLSARRGCPAPGAPLLPGGSSRGKGPSPCSPSAEPLWALWATGTKQKKLKTNQTTLFQLFPVGGSREGTPEGNQLSVPAARLPRVNQPI